MPEVPARLGPEVGLLVTTSQRGIGLGAVAALILTHLSVAVTTLPALARAYPVAATG